MCCLLAASLGHTWPWALGKAHKFLERTPRCRWPPAFLMPSVPAPQQRLNMGSCGSARGSKSFTRLPPSQPEPWGHWLSLSVPSLLLFAAAFGRDYGESSRRQAQTTTWQRPGFLFPSCTDSVCLLVPRVSVCWGAGWNAMTVEWDLTEQVSWKGGLM